MFTARINLLLGVLVALTLLLASGVDSLSGEQPATSTQGAEIYLPLVRSRWLPSSMITFRGTHFHVVNADRGSDGGILLVGIDFGGGPVAMKMDADGQILWANRYSGPTQGYFRTGLLTTDGGAVVAGAGVAGTIGQDIWVLKLDSAGDVTWVTVVGGSDPLEGAYPFSLVQAAGGGYFMVTETRSFGSK